MPSNEPEADLQIIWGGPPPPPVLGNLNRRSTRWWNQFKQSQRDGASLEELEGTSCRIVEALPEPLNWGMSPNPFKGLVVGAVQSGKTASMIGVSAIALDQGFRIIIILAGLKDDLRRQTARRVNSDLLVQNDVVEGFPDQTTLPGEIGPGPLGGYAMNYFYDANYVPSLQILMERALRRDEPCVIGIFTNQKNCPSTFGRGDFVQVFNKGEVLVETAAWIASGFLAVFVELYDVIGSTLNKSC